MRKYLPFIVSSLIALLMFATPGKLAMAAEAPINGQTVSNIENLINNPKTPSGFSCGCQPTQIVGVERNKMVADLISSVEFKTVKMVANSEGFIWNGAKGIDIEKFDDHNGEILVGVPFEKNGIEYMFVFENEEFLGAISLN